jgi:DNA ligase-1
MSDLLPNRRQFIAALAAFGALRGADAAPALLQAQTAPAGIDPTGYLVSEKYDGVRAVWDGHTLRFRSGLPIQAPADFVARLPAVPLDGELWLDRGRFEALSGLVRRQMSDAVAWRQLRYMVFEMPGVSGSFALRAQRIAMIAQQHGWPQVQAVEQQLLDSPQALQRRLDEVVAAGGEGLMLHRSEALYETGRSASLLKLKPLHDAEARVIGHAAGRGRHAGRMGALRVRSAAGVDFLLGTGFSDAEREAPPPLGSWVTFTHRGVTVEGVPRFASFLRVRSEHF